MAYFSFSLHTHSKDDGKLKIFVKDVLLLRDLFYGGLLSLCFLYKSGKR